MALAPAAATTKPPPSAAEQAGRPVGGRHCWPQPLFARQTHICRRLESCVWGPIWPAPQTHTHTRRHRTWTWRLERQARMALVYLLRAKPVRLCVFDGELEANNSARHRIKVAADLAFVSKSRRPSAERLANSLGDRSSGKSPLAACLICAGQQASKPASQQAGKPANRASCTKLN